MSSADVSSPSNIVLSMGFLKELASLRDPERGKISDKKQEFKSVHDTNIASNSSSSKQLRLFTLKYLPT